SWTMWRLRPILPVCALSQPGRRCNGIAEFRSPLHSPTARLREFCKRLQKPPDGSPDFPSPGAWRRPCNHFKVLAGGEALGRMRKVVTPVILLLVAVVHAPIPAQARLFELLPYNFTTSEPVVPFPTGIALPSLGPFASHPPPSPASHRARSRDAPVAVSETPARPAAAPIRREAPAPIKRAA